MNPTLSDRLRHLVTLGDAAAHDELYRHLTRLGMAECVAPPVPEISLIAWTRRYVGALDLVGGDRLAPGPKITPTESVSIKDHRRGITVGRARVLPGGERELVIYAGPWRTRAGKYTDCSTHCADTPTSWLSCSANRRICANPRKATP